MKTNIQVSSRWLDLSRRYTWYEVVELTTNKHPNEVAIVSTKSCVSYRELLEKVKNLAKALFAIGVRKNDHVGIWITNRPEWIYSRFALAKLGAVMVPLQTRYKAYDLAYVLKQSDCKCLIMEDVFLGKIDAMAILREICPELDNGQSGNLYFRDFPLLKNIVCLGNKQFPGCLLWEEIIRNGTNVNDEEIEIRVSPDDDSHIMYTSGTTGFPKGAVQRHRNSVALFAMASELMGIQVGDKFLCNLPFYGNIAFLSTSVCLLTGATIVIQESPDARATLRTIEREKIDYTVLLGPTAMSMLELPDFCNYDLSSLKWILFSFRTKNTFRDIRMRMPHVKLVDAYGQVEGSGLCTWMPHEATDDNLETTVGVELPYCRLAIKDPETDEFLPAGKEGEICSKERYLNTHFMKQYYKQADLTSQVIRNGWLHTGDLGKMDEKGYVTLTGRIKDMLKVGGFNVAPPEIEEYLLRYPKIAEVNVVGVADERLTEVPVAFVRLKYGETCTADEIINYCKNKLANIKVPRHVFFVEEFPRTPQQKIQKFMLRAEAERQLGLNKMEHRETKSSG